MHKTLFISLLSFKLLFADFIGGEISLGIYNHTPTGQLNYKNIASTENLTNFKDSLGWDEAKDVFLKVYFEHPVPLIPNIRLAHTVISQKGLQDVSDFSWQDISSFYGDVNSDFNLNMTDITLYYEILDNWVEADAGLTLRYTRNDFTVSADLVKESLNFSTLIPMLYAKARFNVPMTDLSLQLEANAISYSGALYYDYELSTRYTLAMGLGLEAGYKVFHIDSKELTSEFHADMDFSGAYAAIVWDF